MTSERTWAAAVGQANAYRDLLKVAERLMEGAVDGGGYAEALIHEISRLRQIVTEVNEEIEKQELALAIQQVYRNRDTGRRF